MKTTVQKIGHLAIALGISCTAVPAMAQYGGGGGAPAASSSSSSARSSDAKKFSSYVDFMIQNEKTKDDESLDTAQGLKVIGGFRRNGWYGFEFGLGWTEEGETKKQTASFNTLIYPFSGENTPILNNFYGKIEMGVTRYVDYEFERSDVALQDGVDDFVTANYGAGLGYILPFQIGDRDFAIRTEAVYQVGDRFRERESDFETDFRAPGTFHEMQFNIGLRIPFN